MTDESRYKQAKESTENLLDATKTIQIPEDHKLLMWNYCSPAETLARD